MNIIRQSFQTMCKALPGSYATMAAALGMGSTSALENRIYERKGQAISIHDALQMQETTGRTDFAEAVAQESGGVFVRLPDAPEFAGEDIQEHFMSLAEKVGELITEYRDATDDGQVSMAECERLYDIRNRLIAHAAAIIALTQKYYGASGCQ